MTSAKCPNCNSEYRHSDEERRCLECGLIPSLANGEHRRYLTVDVALACWSCAAGLGLLAIAEVVLSEPLSGETYFEYTPAWPPPPRLYCSIGILVTAYLLIGNWLPYGSPWRRYKAGRWIALISGVAAVPTAISMFFMHYVF